MLRNSEKLPKYVYRQKVKGRTYYRFRRGKGAIRLPGHPGTADFHAAYAKLIAEPERDIGRYTPGSVAHTISLYKASAKFTQLSKGTQRDYIRYLARLDRAAGDLAVSSITKEWVYALQDKLRETPSAANHAVAVIRALFQWAKRRDIVAADPTEGVERLSGGESYKRWTDEQISTFREKADPMMVLALDIGVSLGQRLSDVIALRWEQYDGRRVRLTQQKTGAALSLPVSPALRTLLDALPRTGETILTTKTGRPFHPRVFSRDFMQARDKAGLSPDLSFHGLRHTAASRLAERGKTAPEIQSVTGHKSLKLVEHYIRQAEQGRLADRALGYEEA